MRNGCRTISYSARDASGAGQDFSRRGDLAGGLPQPGLGRGPARRGIERVADAVLRGEREPDLKLFSL